MSQCLDVFSVRNTLESDESYCFQFITPQNKQLYYMDTFQKSLSGNHYISGQKYNWYDEFTSSLWGGVTRIRIENLVPQAGASFALVWR